MLFNIIKIFIDRHKKHLTRIIHNRHEVLREIKLFRRRIYFTSYAIKILNIPLIEDGGQKSARRRAKYILSSFAA